MRRFAMLLFACLIGAVPLTVLGEEGGVGRFFKQISGTDRQIPIGSALMSDKVTFTVQIPLKDGEYSLLFSIYDGSGKQVLNAERVMVAKDKMAVSSVSYGFDPRRDAPGTWWYVAAVNNAVLVSSSINVLAAEPNKALKGDAPKGTRP